MIFSILVYIFTDETPRYLLLNNKSDLAIKQINKIIISNDNNNNNLQNKLNDNEINCLIEWANREKQKGLKQGNILDLFSPKYRKITLLLWVVMFILSFIYLGSIYIFPLILQQIFLLKKSQKINKRFFFLTNSIPVILEMVSLFLTSIIVEMSYFGRRKTTLFSFIFLGICFLLSFFPSIYIFLIFNCLARSISSSVQIISFAFANELYSTQIRNTGISSGLIVSKIAASMMPTILTYSIKLFGVISPSIIFLIFCIIGFITLLNFKYETLGAQLDKDYKI